MFLVSTLEKGSAQNIFPVSTAGKTLKEKIFFVSTYIDKYNPPPRGGDRCKWHLENDEP